MFPQGRKGLFCLFVLPEQILVSSQVSFFFSLQYTFPACPARTSQTKATSPQMCQPPLTCRLVPPGPEHLTSTLSDSPALPPPPPGLSPPPPPSISQAGPGTRRGLPQGPGLPHRPTPALSTAGVGSTSPVEGGRGHEGRAEAVSQV